MEQVAIDSGVVNFEIVSIEVLSPATSRFRRSTKIDYLVTFAISFEAAQDIETSEHLGEILSEIENFKPGSLEVTHQETITKNGEFQNHSGKLTIHFRSAI